MSPTAGARAKRLVAAGARYAPPSAIPLTQPHTPHSAPCTLLTVLRFPDSSLLLSPRPHSGQARVAEGTTVASDALTGAAAELTGVGLRAGPQLVLSEHEELMRRGHLSSTRGAYAEARAHFQAAYAVEARVEAYLAAVATHGQKPLPVAELSFCSSSGRA